MPGFASLLLRVGVVAGLVLATAAGEAPAQRVGINSAVNPDATGTPPGQATRRLVIGQDVVFNEHITTGGGGQTQLLFLDESAMTVGPNSDLTIDQFVFDPQTGTGKLAMSATKGLLRYVGGKLSKQDNAVTLRTSTATLAVRGGAFVANIAPNGQTDAIFIYGKGLTVTGTVGGTQNLNRPNFSTTTTTTNGPTPPAPAPPGVLAAFTAALDGRAGGTGGSTNVPSDTTVASSGLSQTVSGDITQSVQQSIDSGSGAGLASTTTTTTVTGTGPGNPTGILDPCASGGCNQQIVANGGAGGAGAPEQAPPAPVTVTYAGRAKNTNGKGTAQGFVDTSASGDIAYSNGTLTFPQGSPQSGVFTANVGVLGTVSFSLQPGSASFQGTSSTLGPLTGTSFLSADNSFFYASITPTNQPSERVLITGGLPVGATALQPTGSTRIFAFSIQPDAALQSTIPFLRNQAGGSLPGATVSPLYVVAPANTAIGDAKTNSATRGLQASLAINGQGANQQSAIAVAAGTFAAQQSNNQPIFAGQVRGSSLLTASGKPVRVGGNLSSTVDGAGNSIYGSNGIAGFVLDQSQSTETAPGSGIVTTTAATASELPLSGATTAYGFAQPVLPQTVPAGVGTSRTTQALSGNFGGLIYTTAQTNPYAVSGGTAIFTDAATNRISATLNGAADPTAAAGTSALVMQYGALSGAAGGQAFIDNSTFAATESPTTAQSITINGTTSQPTGQLYLASTGAAGTATSILPSGVSYCQCQFLQWGYWGGDLSTPSATGGTPRIDRGHINTWVAGVATPVGDLNTLAAQAITNTYTGHAIGSVFNAGSSYVAAGGFQGTYNFATQNGTFAINNFDGKSFSASGKAPLTGATYTFGLTQAGVSGLVNGTFYGANAAETGGSFSLKTTVGPTYLASGIFAGKK
jgi:hypothetical protein